MSSMYVLYSILAELLQCCAQYGVVLHLVVKEPDCIWCPEYFGCLFWVKFMSYLYHVVLNCVITVLDFLFNVLRVCDCEIRADSRFVPSQWETALLCNDVSHWLGTSLESDVEMLLCQFLNAQFVLKISNMLLHNHGPLHWCMQLRCLSSYSKEHIKLQ